MKRPHTALVASAVLMAGCSAELPTLTIRVTPQVDLSRINGAVSEK